MTFIRNYTDESARRQPKNADTSVYRDTAVFLVDADISARYSAAVFHRGDVLRKWREQLNLSQQQLAKRAGVDKNTVTRAERGESVTTSKLELIVRSLGHSVGELQTLADQVSGEATGTPTAFRERTPLGSDTFVPDDATLLAHLVKACLAAADVSDRSTAQALFEELAVGFATAADPTIGGRTQARRAVQDARELRAKRSS